MKNDKLIQCVPIEMMERLKKLVERLWDDKNPAAVHLSAVMDEFETDIKSLSGVVQEYETDCGSRLKFAEEGYKEKTQALEKDLADYKARLAALAAKRDENAELAAELNEVLKRKEIELTAFSAQFADKEAQLNSKYVTKMQELYDKVSRKELEILSRWEEKHKALELNHSAVENEYAAKLRQVKMREKAMEDEFNSRKEELVKAFDRIRLELDARERAISAREEKLSALEKKRPTMTEEI